MSLVRVKRLRGASLIYYIEAQEQPKVTVIVDCTAGLASDAIVFSFAVGTEGRVTHWKVKKIPAMLIQEGSVQYESEVPELNAAMRRIKVRRTDHLTYLQQLDSQSVDIVYFDPMFRKPDCGVAGDIPSSASCER